ncbi:hypothetical protein BC830DRAFT_440807 [Chytriomyces sp. MP71]|nr:hypothetical protein BC830DRAFT_440807 [Chytriomyces sp. MP71]
MPLRKDGRKHRKSGALVMIHEVQFAGPVVRIGTNKSNNIDSEVSPLCPEVTDWSLMEHAWITSSTRHARRIASRPSYRQKIQLEITKNYITERGLNPNGSTDANKPLFRLRTPTCRFEILRDPTASSSLRSNHPVRFKLSHDVGVTQSASVSKSSSVDFLDDGLLDGSKPSRKSWTSGRKASWRSSWDSFHVRSRHVSDIPAAADDEGEARTYEVASLQEALLWQDRICSAKEATKLIHQQLFCATTFLPNQRPTQEGSIGMSSTSSDFLMHKRYSWPRSRDVASAAEDAPSFIGPRPNLRLVDTISLFDGLRKDSTMVSTHQDEESELFCMDKEKLDEDEDEEQNISEVTKEEDEEQKDDEEEDILKEMQVLDKELERLKGILESRVRDNLSRTTNLNEMGKRLKTLHLRLSKSP